MTSSEQSSSFAFASKLLSYDAFQQEDKIDRELERDFEEIKTLFDPSEYSEAEIHSNLQSQLNSFNAARQGQIINALLYGILTDQEKGVVYFKYLSMCVWDNFHGVVVKLKYFTGEPFVLLQQHVKHQVFWLLGQLLEKQVSNLDSVMLQLLRNVKGGDTSTQNVAMIRVLLTILKRYKNWVLRHHGIITTSVYVFLRCLVDHGDASLKEVREEETSYCVEFLRTKFQEFHKVGRDLVRALLEVRFIPELASVLHDMIQNNGSIPNNPGIEALLSQTTPKHFHQSRLGFQMETQLLFMMQKVLWGENDEFYIDWFSDRYFGHPNSDSLLCDTMRYIICAFHPNNELLASKVIPRYALIGKLLRNPRKNVSPSMKMALLMDWLCYNEKRESVMNIEPSLLLMDRTCDKNYQIITWMVNFIDNVTHEFDDKYFLWFRTNVYKAAQTAVNIRVIKSFDKMLSIDKGDDKTKALIVDLFLTNPDSLNNSMAVVEKEYKKSVAQNGTTFEAIPYDDEVQILVPVAAPVTVSEPNIIDLSDDNEKVSEAPPTSKPTFDARALFSDLEEEKYEVDVASKDDLSKSTNRDWINSMAESSLTDNEAKNLESLIIQSLDVGNLTDALMAFREYFKFYFTKEKDINKLSSLLFNILEVSVEFDEMKLGLYFPLFELIDELLVRQGKSFRQRPNDWLQKGLELLNCLDKLYQCNREEEHSIIATRILIFMQVCDFKEAYLLNTFSEFVGNNNLFEESMVYNGEFECDLFLQLYPYIRTIFRERTGPESNLMILLFQALDPSKSFLLYRRMEKYGAVFFESCITKELLEKSIRWESYVQHNFWTIVLFERTLNSNFGDVFLRSTDHLMWLCKDLPSEYSEAKAGLLQLLLHSHVSSSLDFILLNFEDDDSFSNSVFPSLFRYWLKNKSDHKRFIIKVNEAVEFVLKKDEPMAAGIMFKKFMYLKENHSIDINVFQEQIIKLELAMANT